LARRTERLDPLEAVGHAGPDETPEALHPRLLGRLLAPQVVAGEQPSVEEVDRAERRPRDEQLIDRLRGHDPLPSCSMRTVKPPGTFLPFELVTRTTTPVPGGEPRLAARSGSPTGMTSNVFALSLNALIGCPSTTCCSDGSKPGKSRRNRIGSRPSRV